jgi:hypothetical protein
MRMREKLTKICDSFMGRSFEIPQGTEQNDLARKIQELERRIVDARQLIGTTRFRLRDYLRDI